MKYNFCTRDPIEFQRLITSLNANGIIFKATVGSEKQFGKRSYEQTNFYELEFETDNLPIEFRGIIE